MGNKENIKESGNKALLKEPLVSIRNKLLYYDSSLAMLIGIVGSVYITYEIIFNHEYYYFIFYGLVLWMLISVIWKRKEYKNEHKLPLIKFYKDYVEIDCNVEIYLSQYFLSNNNVKLKKSIKDINVFKSIYSPVFITSYRNRLLLSKEIDIKYGKKFPEYFWNLFINSKVYFLFQLVEITLLSIALNIVLFFKYRNNYRILTLIFDKEIGVRLKIQSETLETPLYLYGVSFLVTNVDDYKKIEELIKLSGGKVVWKLITSKI